MLFNIFTFKVTTVGSYTGTGTALPLLIAVLHLVGYSRLNVF